MTDETRKDRGDEDLTEAFTSEQFIVNAPPKTPPTPERIGKYRIVRKIDEGGMGVVYEAEQTEPIQRRVALKLIKAGMDSKKVIARFNTERQALALMNHASASPASTTPARRRTGSPYFVMEYVAGRADHRSTATRITWLWNPPAPRAVHPRSATGVHHAHQKGIIHRDIKPSNILVRDQNDQRVPKIIDFGIAKADRAYG